MGFVKPLNLNQRLENLRNMPVEGKKKVLKALSVTYASVAAFFASGSVSFALQGEIDSIYTNTLSQLAGPLFSLGLLMFFIGFAGWIFTTDKKKAVFQSIWIFGIVAVILFARNGAVMTQIVTTIRSIAGA